MQTQQWLNRSLPQYLYGAVILLYINAFFGLLTGWVFWLPGLFLIAGHVAAGYGISNERKWGWQLGVAMAFAPMALRFIFFGFSRIFSTDLLNLLFEIVLIVLLLHEESREHQRIWFR